MFVFVVSVFILAALYIKVGLAIRKRKKFHESVKIFLYLSMAIRSRTKIDPRIVNVKAKLKVLQTSLQTNVYGNVRSKI
jgi:sulfur relay (sulfurtransferase) complex TusBCD TusD component (DsrE family)